MAISSEVNSVTGVIRLDYGTTSAGARQTKNINIAGLKKAAFTDEDKQKLVNIKNALAPLFDRSVYDMYLTTKEILIEE